MKKILYLAFTLIFWGCNNQQNEQKTSATENNTKEQKTENQAENQNKTILPLKPETFTWFFGMCDYTATFDADLYTKEELENTLKYLIQGEGTSKSVTIFTPEDLRKIDKKVLEKEFTEILNSLHSLKFVNTPYFNEIKQKRIKEIERIELLTFIEIESYKNPKVLESDKYSKENCSEYTNALIAGGDKLLALRKKMAELSRDEGNNNAWNDYLAETKSDKRLELARIFVSTFGWWNCVNESIERVEGDEAHQAGFLKLFNDVKVECEEP